MHNYLHILIVIELYLSGLFMLFDTRKKQFEMMSYAQDTEIYDFKSQKRRLMPNKKSSNGGSVLVHLSEETNHLLVESSKRSGTSKTREAKIRLEDSLRSFSDLAATGRRFDSVNDCE